MSSKSLVQKVADREADIIGKPERIPPLPREEVLQQALDCWSEMRTNYGGTPVTMADADKIPTIFFTMLRCPDLWMALSEMTMSLTGKASMSRRDSELVILRVGWLCQAPFEWGEHVIKGKEVGITDAEIEQIIEGPTAEGWSEYESALMQAVDELHENAMISDATWDVLAKTMSEAELIELPVLVGQFTTIAYSQNSLRLSLRGVNEGLSAR